MLSGKTALITGASRGIGAAIAEKFASLGANIAIVDYGNVEMALELKKRIEGSIKAEFYQCDVSDFSACKETENGMPRLPQEECIFRQAL